MIVDGNTYCRVITPILPPEYQEVEYIESDGNQYIETNVIPDQDTSINIRFKVKDIGNIGANTGSCIYSGGQSYNNKTKEIYTNGSKFEINCGNAYIYSSIQINKTNVFEVENNKNIYKITNLDTLSSDVVTHNYTTFTAPYSIWLFAVHRQNGIMSNILGKGAKIYKCSILQDTTLVRNFIPCYRKSDNEIGIYDTVNKVFYTNQGTGTFLKGNNVVHTIRYKIPTEERP